MDSKDKHDFINNSLRIEIINKIICENLTRDQSSQPEMISDLRGFLRDHLEILSKLEPL